MEKLKVVLFKENDFCYNTLFFFSSKDVVEKIIEDIFVKSTAQTFKVNEPPKYALSVKHICEENFELFDNTFFVFRSLVSGHFEGASTKDSISLLHSIKTGIVDMNMESIDMVSVSKIVEAIQKGTFSNFEIEIEERESPKKN